MHPLMGLNSGDGAQIRTGGAVRDSRADRVVMDTRHELRRSSMMQSLQQRERGGDKLSASVVSCRNQRPKMRTNCLTMAMMPTPRTRLAATVTCAEAAQCVLLSSARPNRASRPAVSIAAAPVTRSLASHHQHAPSLRPSVCPRIA